MIITGMDEFQSVCKARLVEQYNNLAESKNMLMHGKNKIDLSNVFVVWSCKTLQNYKALLSTSVYGDGVYVEYTYNGDKQELYEDFYVKAENRCISQ